MWELIAVNKRNSLILLAAMAAVLAGAGYLLGLALAGPQAGWLGLLIAAGLWLFLSLISFSQGDQILLASSRAMEVAPDVHPMLFNVVEEMTLAAGLPKMPKIYIIPDESPNAFATGRNPRNASVAVTAGLLTRLNRDQLQGVLAHEISHIVHRDILFVTLAGVMLGAIVILAEVMLQSMRFGMVGGSRRFSGRSSRGASGGAVIVILIAVIAAIVAPLFARILYFALSRRREYLADAGAVRLTRYPEGLAGALEKITQSAIPMTRANRVTAPMYISNPFRAAGGMGLFSTHPPIEQRIRILRSISQGAGYRDYDTAYRQLTRSESIVPPSGLAEKTSVKMRVAGTGQDTVPDSAGIHRQTGDLIRKLEGFEFLNCSCGVKLKVPPNLKTDKVVCPRCGVMHRLDKTVA